MRNTGIIFDTADEAVSFGRYFYRYVYLGKERIQLAAGKTGESSCVYVQCDNPVKAAKQHRQVEARLWETAAAAAEMEEQERPCSFMSGSTTMWNMTRSSGTKRFTMP